MDTQMIGTWKLTDPDSGNFDKYMQCLGVNMLTRKAACACHPNVIISKDGDTYTIKTKSTINTSCITFKLCEEFDEKTADGRECKTTVTVENNTLVQQQRWKGNATTISREVINGQLIVTCVMGEVKCVRVYCKQ